MGTVKKSLDGAARKLKVQAWSYKGISMVTPFLGGDASRSISPSLSLMFAPSLLHMERKRGNKFRVWGDSGNTVLLCTNVFSDIGYVSMVQIAWDVTGWVGHVEGYLSWLRPMSLFASPWLRVPTTLSTKAMMSWSLALSQRTSQVLNKILNNNNIMVNWWPPTLLTLHLDL